MTDKEVMQQALDALVTWAALIDYQYTGSAAAMTMMVQADADGQKAMKALSVALAPLTTEPPYLQAPAYNPHYGDDRECQCGHPYHRHFDSYEDMDPVGCKYCDCKTFVEKT